MTLLEDFLANINYPPALLLKQYLENGIPEDLQPLTQCLPTDWCRKSTANSSELRDFGNAACHSQNYEKALMYYSQSIAAAPTDSEALALAYGNRSAILQAQKEYELCLLDTNRALDGSLPQSSRMTLLRRKAMSWDKLQDENVMRAKLRSGLSTIKRSSQQRANLMTCERRLCYISKVDIDDTDLVIDRSLIDDPMFETKFANEICENLSSKVQRRADEEWGQVFIAVDDIEPGICKSWSHHPHSKKVSTCDPTSEVENHGGPRAPTTPELSFIMFSLGEILSNDVFYCLVVEEDKQHKYCSYCNVWCEAMIPCVSCSQDMYCSVGCREKAYDTYHKTECKILPLWGDLAAGAREGRRLFLRLFLTVTKQGSNLTALLNDPRVYAALNGNLDYAEAQYPSEDFLSVLNSVWKRAGNMDDRFKTMVVPEALQLFIGLRYAGFFRTGERKIQVPTSADMKCSDNILTDEEQLTTVLLVQNLSLALLQVDPTAANFWASHDEPLKCRQDQIGAAVGPWHTFLNQSCHPNAAIVFGGRRIICHSVRPIKAGEQIFLSKGYYYSTITREIRQFMFKGQTGRECSCIACVENWPLSTELMETRNKYLTSNFSKEQIKKIVKMHNWISKKHDYSVAEEDLKKVIEFSRTIRKYVKEPSYTMILCENFISNVMKTKANVYFPRQYVASLFCDL